MAAARAAAGPIRSVRRYVGGVTAAWIVLAAAVTIGLCYMLLPRLTGGFGLGAYLAEHP
jgi:hypothetical protein